MLPVSIPFKRETAFKQKKGVIYEHFKGKFQFPSNGKLHSNHRALPEPRRWSPCFNSLQTGNCIQTAQGPYGACSGWKVSIPFKRETAFKLENSPYEVDPEKSFNSLQTGNCIQTTIRNDGTIVDLLCFNSLQTGNCIQTFYWCRQLGHSYLVSIPFKRETAFKLSFLHHSYRMLYVVSIPFKRETAFKQMDRKTREFFEGTFQFPSNGKLHSNRNLPLPKNRLPACFNSLQTGNCIQTARWKVCSCARTAAFQFPSNGKLHSNFSPWDGFCFLWSVSIPFKRETAFKLLRTHWELLQGAKVSIPFKRETAFKLCIYDEMPPSYWEWFQFPSNGKLHSNFFLVLTLSIAVCVSIPFKRETAFKPVHAWFGACRIGHSFNSLQTGNCIQTFAHCQY